MALPALPEIHSFALRSSIISLNIPFYALNCLWPLSVSLTYPSSGLSVPSALPYQAPQLFVPSSPSRLGLFPSSAFLASSCCLQLSFRFKGSHLPQLPNLLSMRISSLAIPFLSSGPSAPLCSDPFGSVLIVVLRFGGYIISYCPNPFRERGRRAPAACCQSCHQGGAAGMGHKPDRHPGHAV